MAQIVVKAHCAVPVRVSAEADKPEARRCSAISCSSSPGWYANGVAAAAAARSRACNAVTGAPLPPGSTASVVDSTLSPAGMSIQ